MQDTFGYDAEGGIDRRAFGIGKDRRLLAKRGRDQPPVQITKVPQHPAVGQSAPATFRHAHAALLHGIGLMERRMFHSAACIAAVA